MADPASIAVGVIPLVAVAFKSYTAVHSKFSTFVHCSNRVAQFQKRLKFQRRIFENEGHLLLRFAIDDEAVIASMKRNHSHEKWAESEVDEKLKQKLGDNYQDCLEIVQDTKKALDSIQEQLDAFNEFIKYQRKGEKLKHTMKRLQGRVRIVINESSYETALADVKTANSNLSGLREQITALQDIARPKPKERPTPPNTQWMSVCKVRRASKALHHAFSDVWSHAKDSNHLQHVVKMFLEADVKGTMMQPEIHLNLAIVCSASPTCPRTGTLLPLLVKCQQHDELLEIKRPWTPPDSFRPSPPNKRVKIVRFAEEQILRDAYPLESGRNENTQRYGNAETGNLRLSKQVCTDLANAGPSTQNKHGEDCLGYIDVQSDKTFRHLFYPQTSRPWNSQQSHLDLVDPGDVMAMSDLLSPSASRLLTPIEKLRLALRLVKTVLNFHATPWMQDVWRLGDFLFFRQGDDVPAWLQTLHLGIEFTSTTTPRVDNDTSYMEGVLPTPPSERSRGDSDTPLLSSMSEDSRLLCGIDNFQLHCLGVALLQIDHWIQLEPEDVVGVRRLARQPSSLTPRFPSMIQKCLRCDFGCGYNLEQPRLQRAVYEGLVGPLEDMISKLDLGPESDFE